MKKGPRLAFLRTEALWMSLQYMSPFIYMHGNDDGWMHGCDIG